MWFVFVCDDSLSVFIMKIALLLVLLTVGECGSSTVVGRTGQNITLSCKYDIKSNGELSICWNRGEISTSGCNNQLIATGGYKANKETNVSSRYQLLGRLDEGDVSLTILNLIEADAGRYGCRVEISGWFNDQKHHFDLTIEKAPTTTTSTELTTETQQTSASQTPGQMTSTGNLLTSSSSSTSSPESANIKKNSSNSLTVVLVCVLFVFVALITIGGVVIMARRWRQVNKIPQGNSTVQFSSTSSTLHLHSRGSAVENIYQIDEGPSSSEYESCP